MSETRSDGIEEVAAQMADTLRAILSVVDAPRPYPWQGGALKQQIREDLTAYELLGLDDLQGRTPLPPVQDDWFHHASYCECEECHPRRGLLRALLNWWRSR